MTLQPACTLTSAGSIRHFTVPAGSSSTSCCVQDNTVATVGLILNLAAKMQRWTGDEDSLDMTDDVSVLPCTNYHDSQLLHLCLLTMGLVQGVSELTSAFYQEAAQVKLNC